MSLLDDDDSRWPVAALFLGLASATLPLITATGRNFEYEYWLIASLVFGLLTLVRATMSTTKTLGSSLVGLVATLALSALARQLLSCPCATGEFVFWGLWQFIPSALSWIALGLVLRKLLATESLRPAAGLFLAIGLAIAPLLLLWFLPQKRLLTPFIGYIHGPIYDRLLPFTAEQQGLRVSHAVLALGVLVVARWWPRRLTLAATLTLVASFILSTTSTSTHHGHGALRSQLSATVKRPSLTLYYAPGTVPDERAEQLADEAAFHTRDLSKALGLEGQAPEVAIYVYPDYLRKKAWFGGLTTDVTDVYSPSIHITADRFPHGTLRHELVHALTSAEGFYGLGFHPNMAITEGLAVTLAPRPSAFGLHTEAASVLNLYWQAKDGENTEGTDRAKVSGLFGPMFWTYSGSRAYRVAGSLLRYLAERYSPEAVMGLYRGQSFEEAFGIERHEVITGWLEFLKDHYDPALDTIMRKRFSGVSVFDASCPHSKASARYLARSTQATDSFWWRLRGGEDGKAQGKEPVKARRTSPAALDDKKKRRTPDAYREQRAHYRRQLNELYRQQPKDWQARAKEVLGRWQDHSPEGSEDRRTLAIETALLAATPNKPQKD